MERRSKTQLQIDERARTRQFPGFSRNQVIVRIPVPLSQQEHGILNVPVKENVSYNYKRQNELFSDIWKLFSQSCTDVPAQLPSAMLPRQARGT